MQDYYYDSPPPPYSPNERCHSSPTSPTNLPQRARSMSVDHTAALEPNLAPPRSQSPLNAFASRTSLARRRRECLGLMQSLRLSIDLSFKALTLLFCCIMMTMQSRTAKRSSANTDGGSIGLNDETATLYSRLGLTLTATAAEIKAAHRRLAIKYHPDKLLASSSLTGNTAQLLQGHNRFIAIQEAYEILSDPYERRRYDYSILTGSQYQKLPASLRSKQEEDVSQSQPMFHVMRPAAFHTSTASRPSSGQSPIPSPLSSPLNKPRATKGFKTSKSFSSLFERSTGHSGTTCGSGTQSTTPVSPPTPTPQRSTVSVLQNAFKAESRVGNLFSWCAMLVLMFIFFPLRLFVALSMAPPLANAAMKNRSVTTASGSDNGTGDRANDRTGDCIAFDRGSIPVPVS